MDFEMLPENVSPAEEGWEPCPNYDPQTGEYACDPDEDGNCRTCGLLASFSWYARKPAS